MTSGRAAALLIVIFVLGASPTVAAENPASGIFLVAAATLEDPNFRETVVLVTHPRQGAPFGVIINRPLPATLNEAFPDHEGLKARLANQGDALQKLIESNYDPAKRVDTSLADLWSTQ